MKTHLSISMLFVALLAVQPFQGAKAGSQYAADLAMSESWVQEQKLLAQDGELGDEFAYSVSLDGDTALVGARWAKVGSNLNQGAVYVFTRIDGAWTQQAKLTAADGAEGDQFGIAVDLDGNTALIGAFHAGVGENFAQGAAYVFTRSGGTWTQRAKLVAADGSAEEEFGSAVALDGDTVLIGARWATIGDKTKLDIRDKAGHPRLGREEKGGIDAESELCEPSE